MSRSFSCLLLIAMLGLAACGYRLRPDSAELKRYYPRLYIDSEQQFSPFEKQLERYLNAQDIAVVNSPKEAAYILHIINQHYQRQILTVSASTNIRQYMIRFFVNFEIQTTQGEPLTEPMRIQSQRTLSVNSSQMLASDFEQKVIEQDLQRLATKLLYYRLMAPQTLSQIQNNQLKYKEEKKLRKN